MMSGTCTAGSNLRPWNTAESDESRVFEN